MKEKKYMLAIAIIMLLIGTLSGSFYMLMDTKNQLSDTKRVLMETENTLEDTEFALEMAQDELSHVKDELETTVEALSNTQEELDVEKSKMRVEDLREFSSVNELIAWLEKDPVSERNYIKDVYDCEDFAMDLVRNARNDGYEIFVLGMNWISGFTYIDISGRDAVIVARDVGYWIDVRGIYRLWENDYYYYDVYADRLIEVFEPCEIYDVKGYTALVLYETIEMEGHAFCVARINGLWYYIEAQTDEIQQIGIEL
ncbi:MAG: hypothetical protein N2V78_09125 [Methanophagales archaeon]|nr:hypothetical protein [Methanophagales archaeon]